MIYTFGHVSGAHFNPAVTFAHIITGRKSLRLGLAYMAIQLYASVMATFALMVVFPGVNGGSVFSIPSFVVVDIPPEVHLINAFMMEMVLTFILVYVILATALDSVDVKPVKVDADVTQQNRHVITIYVSFK